MTESKSSRVAETDVLRGLAVAGMIIVTSPGDWGHTYSQLQHAAWHGWTLTDMVFPTFLFAVGMSLGLSFPGRMKSSEDRRVYWLRVGRRAVALILLGLILNSTYILAVHLGAPPIGPDDRPGLRIPGVLQRIAVCYVIAALIIVATSAKDEQQRTVISGRAILLTIVIALAGYWALLRFISVPGFGPGRLDQVGSLPAYLDRQIFTPPHLWPMGSTSWRGPVTYDPEGLLSSIPATVNVLFGVLAGREWRRAGGPRFPWIAGASAAVIVLGLLLNPWLPINKRIWTSSFALLSSGFSGLLLVAIALSMRGAAMQRLTAPLKVLGGNAVLAFSASILLGAFATLPFGVPAITPQAWGNSVAGKMIPDPYLASLGCAFAILVFITLALWPLHRRAVYFRL